MAFSILNVLNKKEEEKPKAINTEYFNESSKVIREFIRKEEEEDRRTSPMDRQRRLKLALESTKTHEEYKKIKEELEELELSMQFKTASKLVHAFPKEKADMIMENYHIENAEALEALQVSSKEIDKLNAKIEELNAKLDLEKIKATRINKMIEEARVIPLAAEGKLIALYNDDYPTLFQRNKGFSDLNWMNIRVFKEGV